MSTVNQDLLERLDQWVDDALPALEASELVVALDENADLGHERLTLERLHEVLARDRIEVDEQFAHSILELVPRSGPLPARARPGAQGAPGKSARAASWAVAIAMAGLLALVAAALLRGAGSPIGPLAALVDFARSTVLAGSGLLAASWLSLGDRVNAWLGAAAPGFWFGAVLVVSINALLFALLRRRRVRARSSREDGDRL